MTKKILIRHRSTTGTRLTPQWIIEMSIELMGGIDLDPTSEPGPPYNVPSTTHWTKQDDCLNQPIWSGRAFVNPPYGKKRGIDKILARLDYEYRIEHLSESLVLLPVDTSTGWWRILGNEYPWCAFSKRIKFDGMDTGAGFPSAMFYLGENIPKFITIFSRVGQIYQPIG